VTAQPLRRLDLLEAAKSAQFLLISRHAPFTTDFETQQGP
jgi:hypothetical protein